MPTLITHALVGGGVFLAIGHGRPGARLGAWTAAALGMLPDVDALFMRSVPYASAWGHRGESHSLVLAGVAGLAGAFALRRRVLVPGGSWGLALLLAVATATHGLLDAMTDGGEGVALLAPFLDRRYFLPWREIPVAPLGLHPMLLPVIAIEAWMIWPAALALATVRVRLRLGGRLAVIAALVASAVPWILGMGMRPI